MKFKLKRSYKVNNHKTLVAGQVMDVTEKFYAWLQENDYDKKEKTKEKKTNKASDKGQKL